MGSILLVSGIAAAQAAFGWIDQVPTGPDLADLHGRLSQSAFVVKGRLLSQEPVLPAARPTSRQIGPNLWAVEPVAFPIGGAHFTVAVEEIFCREGDFAVTPPAHVAPPNLVHVFVPFGDPQSEQSKFDPNRHNRREWLLPDRDYLLFLYNPPGQDVLLKTYRLEPGLTYYRTVEGQRGAVALPDAANPEKPREFITPLARAVTVFCEAVKGPDAATKIRQLEGVRSFFEYPAWRQSVDEAIRAFRTPARQ